MMKEQEKENRRDGGIYLRDFRYIHPAIAMCIAQIPRRARIRSMAVHRIYAHFLVARAEMFNAFTLIYW
jgi:hypothetical protein